MVEARLVSATIEDTCRSEGSTASLHLRWRLSSSKAIDQEVVTIPEGSAACWFSEAGSFADSHLLSSIVGLSLGLEDEVPAYYCR